VSALTVTGANGTSTLSATGYVSDSTTAASVTVTGLLDTARDSITVSFVAKSVPALSAANAFLYLADTTTPAASSTVVETAASVVALVGGAATGGITYKAAGDTTTGIAVGSTPVRRISHTSTGYVGAKFAIQLDSTTTRIAGTYTYTVIVKSFNAEATNLLIPSQTITQDVSIVVSASDATVALTGATAIDAGRTKAWLNAGSSYTTANDSAVSVVSTASATDHATLRVTTFTAAGDPAPESVTVTVTGAGVICNGSICGKSIKVIGTAGSTDFTLRADGTAGTSSIVVATTSKTFAAKTVNFFAKAASTFATPSVARPVIGTGSVDDVVRVTATDASGNPWTGTAYIYATSAASALIAGSATPVACTYDSADVRHECPVSGTSTGTASFKIIDASTVALATATSSEVSVRVSTATAASISMAWDKSTYLPGEKAILRVTVLDSAGLAIPTGAITNLYATGAITTNMVLTAVSTTASSNSVSPTVAAANSSSDPNNLATAGMVTYIFTMPQTTGTLTATAKGGAGLPLAGQVTVTASAEITNPSADAATDAANEATDAANAATDAALAAADAADAATAAAEDAAAAVATLAASVSTALDNLKKQISALAALVNKLLKKK
jgi:hypothetical protein